MATTTLRALPRIHKALRSAFAAPLDAKGYVSSSEDNLLPTVLPEDYEEDLLRGRGNELGSKFLALHSSSALVVNHFGPLRRLETCWTLPGQEAGANLRLEFERPFPIFRGGTPPHFDVLLTSESGLSAIESKFLEYFVPKRPAFRSTYERLAPSPTCGTEPCWWEIYQWCRGGSASLLDVAQIVKHYFGLRRHQLNVGVRRLPLYYLFWEPANWMDFEECARHRQLLRDVATVVAGSDVPLVWHSYGQIWDHWEKQPGLETHVALLRERYQRQVE